MLKKNLDTNMMHDQPNFPKKKQVLIEKQHPNGQLINIKQLSISSNFQFNQLTIRTKIPNFAKNT